MENHHIIQQTEQLQKYVRINVSVLRQSFLPFEFDAQEKFLLPYLGDSLLFELRTLENENNYPEWADTPEKKQVLGQLLEKCKRSLAKFTIYLATPHMDLHLSEMGFVVTHTSNSAPASAHRVQAARDALLSSGYDSLEIMLRHLEAHHHKIDSYKNSEAFLFSFSSLISSADEFNSFLPIGRSRLHFASLKGEMANLTDMVIAPIASKELIDELIQGKQKQTLSEHSKKALFLMQKAIAHLTAANTLTPRSAAIYLNPSAHSPQAFSDLSSGGTRDHQPVNELILRQTKDRLNAVGQAHLAALKKLLQNNPDKFPAYKNSKAFSEADKTKSFENTDSPLFVFGQPPLE